MSMPLNEQVLEAGLANLETSRSWSPRVISRLESFIRTADDFSLYYVNPLAFAKDKGIGETEALDLFLNAAAGGLFQLHWQLMCPCCGDRIRNFRSLRVINAKYFCNFCQIETTASLDDFIEVSFTVTPQLKPVAFHHPEALPIEDYCYKFRLHPCGRLPGGPAYVDLMRQHTVGMAFIAPGTEATFEFEAATGAVLGHDFANGAGFQLEIGGKPRKKTQNLDLVFQDGAFQPRSGTISPGRIALTIRNTGTAALSFVSLAFPAAVPTDLLVFDPFLSGKRLLTTRTYHDLFRSEVAPGMEGIGVRDITILFTDLKGSTAMYDRVGDLKAYSLVRQHFSHLERAINQAGGVLVKTIGDAIMAAFPRPEQAARSAVEMIREIRGFNATLGGKEEIRLKVGLHRGNSIVVALNDRLDYFGQTVNVAARVQGLADADEIYLTDEVFKSSEARAFLGAFKVEPETARLKGVQEEWKVYRVRNP